MNRISSVLAASIITLSFFSCQSEEHNGEKIIIDSAVHPDSSSVIKQDSTPAEETFAGKPISFYLVHHEIPQEAKAIYRLQLNPNNMALNLPDSLFSKKEDTKAFYFLAFTRSLQQSDGAYSETAGLHAKGFVESNTGLFLTYFTEEPLLNEADFDQWIIAVAGEIMISDEKKEMEALGKMSSLMKANCPDCTATKERKLNEFIKKVKENILKHTR